jgi:hypothetical protein
MPTEGTTEAALDAKLHGLSRNDAAERAAVISKIYRDGGHSGAIRRHRIPPAYWRSLLSARST